MKSEYVHGELFAMTGASIPHNLVTANVITAFNNALDGKDCSVFAGDTKIEIEPGAHYVYPDVSVACGDVLYGRDRNDVLANPMVIVEVLSKSTRDYDRGSKFQSLPAGWVHDRLLVGGSIRDSGGAFPSGAAGILDHGGGSWRERRPG